MFALAGCDSPERHRQRRQRAAQAHIGQHTDEQIVEPKRASQAAGDPLHGAARVSRDSRSTHACPESLAVCLTLISWAPPAKMSTKKSVQSYSPFSARSLVSQPHVPPKRRSSSSMIAASMANGTAPPTNRPLTNMAGVPDTPATSPARTSASTASK